jgi:hypothetical protein
VAGLLRAVIDRTRTQPSGTSFSHTFSLRSPSERAIRNCMLEMSSAATSAQRSGADLARVIPDPSIVTRPKLMDPPGGAPGEHLSHEPSDDRLVDGLGQGREAGERRADGSRGQGRHDRPHRGVRVEGVAVPGGQGQPPPGGRAQLDPVDVATAVLDGVPGPVRPDDVGQRSWASREPSHPITATPSGYT